MKNIIKKADIVLFIVLVLLGAVLTVASLKGGETSSATVVIEVGGEVYGTYPLSKDQVIEIVEHGHYNKVQIKDNKIQMLKSDCENQICVMTGELAMSYFPIVCLPNQVMVYIVDGEEGADVVSG